MRASLLGVFVGTVLVFAVASASAGEIYKFKKSDGTIVYTDNIGQLPNDRREYYNRLEQEAAQKRAELERSIGKEELERREAEAKKSEIERAKLEAAERQRRLQAIEATLSMLKDKSGKRDAERGKWQDKMKKAVQKRSDLLAAFNAAQEKYNGLATKPNFTLLPGQVEEMENAKKDMDRLEKELDVAIEDVMIKIPDEARKAGIPPGWLR